MLQYCQAAMPWDRSSLESPSFWETGRGWKGSPLAHHRRQVCGEPAAKPSIGDLLLGRDFVNSSVTPSMRSIESALDTRLCLGACWPMSHELACGVAGCAWRLSLGWLVFFLHLAGRAPPGETPGPQALAFAPCMPAQGRRGGDGGVPVCGLRWEGQ